MGIPWPSCNTADFACWCIPTAQQHVVRTGISERYVSSLAFWQVHCRFRFSMCSTGQKEPFLKASLTDVLGNSCFYSNGHANTIDPNGQPLYQ